MPTLSSSFLTLNLATKAFKNVQTFQALEAGLKKNLYCNTKKYI